MFFSPALVLYIPILALLVLVASSYERRVGHVRTLVVAIGGQFVGRPAHGAVPVAFEDTGWTWARELGHELDLGISAGGFALIGALTAVMQPVWRNRIRIGFGAYLFAHGARLRPAVGRRALRRLRRSASSPDRSSPAARR